MTVGVADKAVIQRVRVPPGQTLASYSYNGGATTVAEQFPQPDVKLDYISDHTDAAPGSGEYEGFDRFGRVKDQKWIKSTTVKDRYQYGYDYSSNRLWRENSLTHGTANGYDGLDRLKEFRRCKLNANKDTIADGNTTRRQVFTLDQVGNWTRFQKDDDGHGPNGGGNWDRQFTTADARAKLKRLYPKIQD